MKFISPTSVIAFKKIFANNEKKHILIKFLNDLLELKGEDSILNVNILNPYQNPNLKDLKDNSVNILSTTSDDNIILIKLVMEKQSAYFDKKAIFHTANSYTSQIVEIEDIDRLQKVCYIGLLDFIAFDKEEMISNFAIIEKNTMTEALSDLEFIFIELPKFNRNISEFKIPFDKWLYFLTNSANIKTIPAELKHTEEIVEGFSIIEKRNWLESELDIYEWSLSKEKNDLIQRKLDINKAETVGFNSGIEKGKIEGTLKTKLEIIKNSLKNGLDIQTISKITDLQVGHIEKLIESL